MKTCPDCAESVQDAARKCRYCGYEFAPAPVPAGAATADAPPGSPAPASPEGAQPAAPAAPATSSSSSPSPWPYLLVAIGGALVGIGGVVLCLFGAGVMNKTIAAIADVAMPLGGLLLAIGWSPLLARGDANIGAVFGGAILCGTWIAAMCLTDKDYEILRGVLASGGLLFCAAMHINTLEGLVISGAQVAAQVSAIAFGLQLLPSVKVFEWPEILQEILMFTGFGGTMLFGFAIAVSALSIYGAGSNRATPPPPQ